MVFSQPQCYFIRAMASKTANPGFIRRLKEIDMFFQRRSPVHQTMRRLAQRLEKAGITYAVVGGMAVNAHGAERTTKDVDVLLTTESFGRFREAFVGDLYEPVPKRSRRFKEKKSGVTVDFLLTGKYPGNGQPGPITFPDPEQVAQKIEKIAVVSLPQLIQLKLAARRYYDFGDVVFLMRVHNLDESFAEKLHASIRQEYVECLEEKRREDEYQAREE
jgi:hypothetical protein